MPGPMTRRALVGALAATAVATLAPAAVEAQTPAQTRPEVTVSLLGAPFGTGTYVLSSALEST